MHLGLERNQESAVAAALEREWGWQLAVLGEAAVAAGS